MEIEDVRIQKLERLIEEEFGGVKAAFARKIGKSPSYVSRWFSEKKKESSRNLKSETARYIEQKCHKPKGWLDRLEEPKAIYDVKTTREGAMKNKITGVNTLSNKVPLISWAEAITWPQPKHLRGNEVTYREVKTDQDLGPDGYALAITNDSYINPHGGQSIMPGATIYVDRDARPENGSAVIVHIEGNDEAALFKMEIVGAKRYLKPFNPVYPPFEWDDKCRLCGVAVGFYSAL